VADRFSDHWRSNSFQARWSGDPDLVRVNFQEWPLQIKARPVETFTDESSAQRPLIRKVRQ